MARFGAGVLSATVTATRPAMGLMNGASNTFILREAGITNTTSTNSPFHLALLTAAGTIVSTPAQTPHRYLGPTSTCDAVTWSADPTVGATLGYRHMLGAAIGAGVIWTFGGDGIQTNVGIANGVSLALESGTGVAVEAYMIWDE